MARSRANTRIGLLLGLLGVVCFSLTLPATRIAVPQLGAIVVAFGRAIVAAALAGVLLALRREQFPIFHIRALITTGLGVVVGFPLFSAMALKTVPAVHGAVIVGFTPAATAVFATIRDRERSSLAFWVASALGLVAIVIFAEVQGAGTVRPSDLLLLLAVASAAYGYVEGARVARKIGGWRTICWALVLTAPMLTIPVGLEVLRRGGLHASLSAWIGFAYVAVISMFLGFFAWYSGLALGGTARVGQLQLLQLPLTVLWGALFLGESVGVRTVGIAAVVVASAATAVRFRIGETARASDVKTSAVRAL